MFDVLELHRKLAAVARPSGSEQTGVAQVLQALAAPFVDEITTDAMGNLICHKKGPGERIMLAAHMDAIGFIVTGLDENGFADFDGIGGHSPAELVNCRVVFPNGTHGIIRARETSQALSRPWNQIRYADLYLDIGASSLEEAQTLIRIGDMAAFEGLPELAAGSRIVGPYADDLIGCVVLLLTMEQAKAGNYDVYYVFSTQEEVGCRGALSAAQAIRPALGIACDVCGVDDTPASPRKVPTRTLGNGPTIKIKDHSVICSPALNARLRQTARDCQIPWQEEILTGGGTDTSAMQKALENVAATCVSIPTRHIHSPAETYDKTDAELAGRLLAAFLNT